MHSPQLVGVAALQCVLVVEDEQCLINLPAFFMLNTLPERPVEARLFRIDSSSADTTRHGGN